MNVTCVMKYGSGGEGSGDEGSGDEAGGSGDEGGRVATTAAMAATAVAVQIVVFKPQKVRVTESWVRAAVSSNRPLATCRRLQGLSASSHPRGAFLAD